MEGPVTFNNLPQLSETDGGEGATIAEAQATLELVLAGIFTTGGLMV